MKLYYLFTILLLLSRALNASELDGNGFDDSGIFGLAPYNCNYELLEKSLCSWEINAQNKQRCTALHLAARYGADKNVALLLSKGTNPNIKEHYDKTPLDYAFSGLLGSNFNGGREGGRWGNYHKEKVERYVTIITILLDHGADPNYKRHNSTLLHSIAFLNSAQDPVYYDALKRIMEQLVKNKVDSTIKNDEGYTPYQYAKKYDQNKIIEIFESVGIKE